MWMLLMDTMLLVVVVGRCPGLVCSSRWSKMPFVLLERR